jgi:hypothetical protein
MKLPTATTRETMAKPIPNQRIWPEALEATNMHETVVNTGPTVIRVRRDHSFMSDTSARAFTQLARILYSASNRVGGGSSCR